MTTVTEPTERTRIAQERNRRMIAAIARGRDPRTVAASEGVSWDMMRWILSTHKVKPPLRYTSEQMLACVGDDYVEWKLRKAGKR